jgi:plastocyanin
MRAVRRLALAAALLLPTGVATVTPTGAAAADLTVQVRDLAGRPVREAVVLVRPAGAPHGALPKRFDWPLVMSQRDVAFDPHTLVVPVGSEVSFPNRDKVRHHVYSFSPTKRFELKLYGKDESRSVTFDKPGPVAMGCNIHDKMSAFIYVSDTRHVGLTTAAGAAVVRGLPNGPATLTVWHPYMKTRGASVERKISLTADAVQAIAVDVR